MTPSRTPAATRAIIRMAMLSGILTVYGVFWWLRGRGEVPVASADRLRLFSTLVTAGTAFAVAAILFLKTRMAGADARQEGTLAIIMLAVGEMVALCAGVVYLQGASPAVLATGLLAFAVAMVASRPGAAP